MARSEESSNMTGENWYDMGSDCKVLMIELVGVEDETTTVFHHLNAAACSRL